VWARRSSSSRPLCLTFADPFFNREWVCAGSSTAEERQQADFSLPACLCPETSRRSAPARNPNRRSATVWREGIAGSTILRARWAGGLGAANVSGLLAA
jgi:hypothetical protein